MQVGRSALVRYMKEYIDTWHEGAHYLHTYPHVQPSFSCGYLTRLLSRGFSRSSRFIQRRSHDSGLFSSGI
jgi:hypothetical protein